MCFPSLPDSTVVHSSLAGLPAVLLQGIFRSRIFQGDGRAGDLRERHNFEAGGWQGFSDQKISQNVLNSSLLQQLTLCMSRLHSISLGQGNP